MLNLPQNRLLPTLLVVDEASIQRRLNGEDKITGSSDSTISPKARRGFGVVGRTQYLGRRQAVLTCSAVWLRESMPNSFGSPLQIGILS